MASTFSLTSQSYEGRYLRLTCTQTKDIAANKSQIAWTLSSIGGTEVYYATGPTTVIIGGTTVYYSGRVAWNSYKFPAAKGSVSGTVDIYHDDLGAKTIEVSLTTAIYYSTGQTFRENWTLDNIPRASQPSCITYPQTTEHVGTLGESVRIYMNSADSSFRHALYYWRNNGWNLIASDIQSSYLWTTPVDFANDVPNSTEYVGLIAVDTYSGSTFIGTKTVSFKANVPAYDITGTVTVSGNNLYEGLYVEGKSSATITIAPKLSYGATVKSITSTVDEKTYTNYPFVTSALSKGTKSVKSVIVDSRGRTGTIWSTEFNVIEYSRPWITSFTVERQDNGTTVIARLQGGVSPIENKNTKLFEITLNGVTKGVAVNGYTVDGTTTFTNVPTDESFTATARVADWYTYTAKEATLPTINVTLDFHHSGKGIAMGKVAEDEDLLDIAWDIKLKGSIIADFVVEQGTSGIWTYRKWYSGIAECWGTYEQEDVNVSAAWGSLYESPGYNVALPSGLFSQTPTFTVALDSSLGCMLQMYSQGTTSSTPYWCAIRPYAGTIDNLKTSITAKGRWK